MTTFKLKTRSTALAIAMMSAAYPLGAVADDVVSFATGGYAAGLRTKEMKGIIDTDGDGTISRAEWDAYQEKVFKLLDSHNKGSLSTAIFVSRTRERLTSFATGGYARGLGDAELARKIDANGDGRISHDEFMAYQGTIFDMMNTSMTHRDILSDTEMFATGGANRP